MTPLKLPLKHHCADCGTIEDAGGEFLFYTPANYDAAVCDEIIRRVNLHDELVGILKLMRNRVVLPFAMGREIDATLAKAQPALVPVKFLLPGQRP